MGGRGGVKPDVCTDSFCRNLTTNVNARTHVSTRTCTHAPPDAPSAVLLAVCLKGVSACVISGDVHLVTRSPRHL